MPHKTPSSSDTNIKSNNDDQQQNTSVPPERHPVSETGPPIITIDYDRYADALNDSDLTDAQKKEFLDTLWNIIVSFVDLGYGVHPVQQEANKPMTKINADSQSLDNLINQYGTATNSATMNNTAIAHDRATSTQGSKP